MSVLFPKVNQPREWDYRPRYYDEKKEARKQRLARLQHGEEGHEGHGLEKGAFREQHEKNMSKYSRTAQVSRLGFWIALLLLLIYAYYLLS